MGENPGSGSQYVAVGESASPKATNHMRKVSVLPLVFLIFYEVSGGPFSVEDTVKATGPLLALLGFLVFPFIWSVPEALITAEMGTMFPENSGYVVWVSTALGPFWGFQQGWMKWLSGVIDNALLDESTGYIDYDQFSCFWFYAMSINVIKIDYNMANPDFAMAFQNPRVQEAIMDCSQNPMSIAKYQNDKEVMDVFYKISELFPGVSGPP
ncbi:hypothetical protein RYX36_006031 [Vicia faba]